MILNKSRRNDFDYTNLLSKGGKKYLTDNFFYTISIISSVEIPNSKDHIF